MHNTCVLLHTFSDARHGCLSLQHPRCNPSPYHPPLLTEVRGITPGKIFGIKDARTWVLEQSTPLWASYFTVSRNFRISSKCAWSSDRITEMPPLRWVIAAFQSCKLSDRGRLVVALHCTEFQAIFFFSLKFQRRNVRRFLPRMDAMTLGLVDTVLHSYTITSTSTLTAVNSGDNY